MQRCSLQPTQSALCRARTTFLSAARSRNRTCATVTLAETAGELFSVIDVFCAHDVDDMNIRACARLLGAIAIRLTVSAPRLENRTRLFSSLLVRPAGAGPRVTTAAPTGAMPGNSEQRLLPPPLICVSSNCIHFCTVIVSVIYQTPRKAPLLHSRETSVRPNPFVMTLSPQLP